MRRGGPERLVISRLYKELGGGVEHTGCAVFQPAVALNGVFTRYAHAHIYSVARARPRVNDTESRAVGMQMHAG